MSQCEECVQSLMQLASECVGNAAVDGHQFAD